MPLPVYYEQQRLKGPPKKIDPNGQVAHASELLALGDGKFLVLARDSNRGRGLKSTESLYRHVDVVSVRGATNIQARFDGYKSAYAPGGKLVSGVVPAKYCEFLDINVNAELNRFMVQNGSPDELDFAKKGLLNEKWEGLAMMPVEGKKGEYFLFVSSDNDFVTQDGRFNFGKDRYVDKMGIDLDNQHLVYKIKIE